MKITLKNSPDGSQNYIKILLLFNAKKTIITSGSNINILHSYSRRKKRKKIIQLH